MKLEIETNHRRIIRFEQITDSQMLIWYYVQRLGNHSALCTDGRINIPGVRVPPKLFHSFFFGRKPLLVDMYWVDDRAFREWVVVDYISSHDCVLMCLDIENPLAGDRPLRFLRHYNRPYRECIMKFIEGVAALRRHMETLHQTWCDLGKPYYRIEAYEPDTQEQSKTVQDAEQKLNPRWERRF